MEKLMGKASNNDGQQMKNKSAAMAGSKQQMENADHKGRPHRQAPASEESKPERYTAPAGGIGWRRQALEALHTGGRSRAEKTGLRVTQRRQAAPSREGKPGRQATQAGGGGRRILILETCSCSTQRRQPAGGEG
ncbi:MAG: hypothetical protein M1813_005722 [Trichoglossum hirsutum]|nr:MAG: hypothetical protein M1813_005722 [Trichoglossum hirsutum]